MRVRAWPPDNPVYSGPEAGSTWPLIPFASLLTDRGRRDGNTNDQSASAFASGFHVLSGHGRCCRQQPDHYSHGCLCSLFCPSTWTAPAVALQSSIRRSLLRYLNQTLEPTCHGHVEDTTVSSARQCPRTPKATAGAAGTSRYPPTASQYCDGSPFRRRHRPESDSGLSGNQQEKSGAHRNRRRERQSEPPWGLRPGYRPAACRRGRRRRIERAYMLVHEGAQGAPASKR